MNISERRERLRAVLAGDQCVYPAPVYDPISARIAEDLGFEVGFMTPSWAVVTVLATPHLGLLTLSELAEQVRSICRASSISFIVGVGYGYGNALNVMRTVEELESAGVSALTIDDAALPIRFRSGVSSLKIDESGVPIGSGGTEGKERLTSLEEGIGKMKAALAARQDPSLVIVARTSALEFEGIPETIRRVKAYEMVGVDAIFIPVFRTPEEVEAVHAATSLPLLRGHLLRGLEGIKELGDKRFLAANGVRIASPGGLTLFASVKAVYDTLKGLRDGKSPADLRSTLASPELLAQVTRQSQYEERIQSFLN